MNLRNPLHLLTVADCKKVSLLDSEGSKEYVDNNTLSYYVVINTWLHIIQVIAPYAWRRVGELLLTVGLIPMIKSAADSADQVVHDNPITDPIWKDIARECHCHYTMFSEFNRLDPLLNIGRDYQATLLFILRYPKRFTPNSNYWIQEQTLKEFVIFENRMKLMQRRYLSPLFVDWVRREASRLLSWDDLYSDIDSISEADYVLSTGAAYDSTASVGSKFKALYYHGVYGLPLIEHTEDPWYRNDKGELMDYRPVKILAVPKSYKSSRIIAMEDTYRQAIAKRVSQCIRKYTPIDIDVTDQTRNQELARLASITGSFATLDLSHGSDGVTKRLIRELLPAPFVDRIIGLVGTHTEVQGKSRLMQTFSTAGNCLTFDIETIVFYIICKAAVGLYDYEPTVVSFYDNGRPILSNTVSVYGDDIIVPTYAAETCISLLEYFGFIINKEKSFIDGDYRESCGEEYYKGVSNTSLYFPRFPIVGSITNDGMPRFGTSSLFRDEFRGKIWDSTTMLIDLQHKLFDVCYPASRFLYELIRKAYPRMTFSSPGSKSADLWEYGDSLVLRKFPYLSPDQTDKVYRVIPDYSGYVTRDLSGRCSEVIEMPAEVDYLHMAPSLTYRISREPNTRDIHMYDLYRYYEFLRVGPSYRDDLHRLLKVSDPPRTYEECFGRPAFKWNMIG